MVSLQKIKVYYLLFLIAVFPLSVANAVEEVDDFRELWDACAEGSMEIVMKYIAAGHDVAKLTTVEGETCLHITASSNSLGIVNLLLDLDADVNYVIEHPKGYRNTPLAWHIYQGNYRIVKLLLEKGANVNANFDAVGDEERKITAMDLADALSTKHNMEEKYMKTFLYVRQYGGKKYVMWEAEKQLRDSGLKVIA